MFIGGSLMWRTRSPDRRTTRQADGGRTARRPIARRQSMFPSAEADRDAVGNSRDEAAVIARHGVAR
ncbi:MAG: hypothetical protein MUC68_04240 [Burkholderiaceae bacterium]|nr:hypothetical protein [Burkholderiaceae bacterium]